MKPFEVEKILQSIQDKLKKQGEETSYSEDGTGEFIETHIKASDTAN